MPSTRLTRRAGGRFEEYLEIILKAWTTEEFSFEGEHYKCHNLSVRPKPYQDPYPPIRVGITSADTFPIIGRMGYPIFVNPSRVFALSELAGYIDDYQRAWKEAGHPGKGKVGLRLPFYVAESAERAYEDPKESISAAMQGLADRVLANGRQGGHHGQLAGPSRPDQQYDLRRLGAGQSGLWNAGCGA